MSNRNAPSENEHASLLPFGRGAEGNTPLPRPVALCGLNLYRQVRAAYEEAGSPCGPGDTAMLVWYTFQADIAACGPAPDGGAMLPVHWN
jgi:hypothetical protein